MFLLRHLFNERGGRKVRAVVADDLVLANAHLLSVVVTRNGDDVLWIDLADDDTPVRVHALCVCDGADMEAGVAFVGRIVRDHVPRHLVDAAWAVVERVGVVVLVVGPHGLVGEEVPFWSERDAPVLEERPELVHRAEARVLLESLPEVEEALWVITLRHHLDDARREVAREWLAVVGDGLTLDGEPPLRPRLDALADGEEVGDCVPLLIQQRIPQTEPVRGSPLDRMAVPVEDERQRLVGQRELDWL